MLGFIASLAWGWIKTPIGNVVVGVGVLFVAWQFDRAGQRSVGAERAKIAISEATNARIQTGDRAASKSRAGGLSGGAKIDPTTRP